VNRGAVSPITTSAGTRYARQMAIRPELRDELMMDQARANEIRRRIEQIRSGLIEGVPAQKVFAQVRERLAARRNA